MVKKKLFDSELKFRFHDRYFLYPLQPDEERLGSGVLSAEGLAGTNSPSTGYQ